MKTFPKIFVTGATGFIGTVLTKRLFLQEARITAAVLPGEDAGQLPPSIKRATIGALGEDCDYTKALKDDTDVVIHLAARVHIMKEIVNNPLEEFRRVNSYGTKCLALQAAKAGVKRFVFMSTVGVNGNTSGSRAFTETDEPRPHNSYSVSKLEAEMSLKEIGKSTGMEIVIVRAPLVYGPGNPGNFLSLLNIISKGIPLPFASIKNGKTFLYVENLADALACCAIHPAAAGQTYMVCDGEIISTPELIRKLGALLGKHVRLFPFPAPLALLAGKMLGMHAAVKQLSSSLVVDSSKILNELGWKPPYSMEDGLSATAQWYACLYRNVS